MPSEIPTIDEHFPGPDKENFLRIFYEYMCADVFQSVPSKKIATVRTFAQARIHKLLEDQQEALRIADKFDGLDPKVRHNISVEMWDFIASGGMEETNANS